MKDIIQELFLREYFLFRSVLGGQIGERRRWFTLLARQYFVDDAQADELFPLTESDAAEAIATAHDYMQYCRIKQYAKIGQLGLPANAADDEMIAIKGSASVLAEGLGLGKRGDPLCSEIYNKLSFCADGGNVHAMRVLGTLLCEGGPIGQNIRAGRKYLEMSADWNDVGSLLALLAYGTEGRAFQLSRLFTATYGTPYFSLYERASAAFCMPKAVAVGEVRLLEQAFRSGALKRDTYEPKYARIVYGSAASLADRERAVFSASKEYLSAVGDLPLKLRKKARRYAVPESVKYFPLPRDGERKEVLKKLQNADLCGIEPYRPLCICSDSHYLLNLYAEFVTELGAERHTERIEISRLTGYDLEPTQNNVFLRSVDEDRDNSFLLFFTGEIQRDVLESSLAFLNGGQRMKFHLNNPSATLDLSAVLPVCFCDRANVKHMRDACDVLFLADVTREEMPSALLDMLSVCARRYGVERAELDDGLIEELSVRTPDEAERILDEAVRANRTQEGPVILKTDDVQAFIRSAERGKRGFGFGGIGNGNQS